jgi:hypothetical protein
MTSLLRDWCKDGKIACGVEELGDQCKVVFSENLLEYLSWEIGWGGGGDAPP